MKLKTLALTASLLCGLSVPCFAADAARHQAVLQLLNTLHFNQTLDQMQAQMMPVMAQQFKKELDGQGCGPAPDCKQKVQAAFDKLQKEMADYFASPRLRQLMLSGISDFYESNFTLDEIHQIDAFYLTPVGQKQLRLGPQAATKIMPALMQDMQTHLRPRLQALSQQLKQDLAQ